ncbi:hypothetical protein FGRMN_2810 [Fusarium graminum]|nr:hypothetical protein FGRMN_2810 [Fusarium graminum]
MQKEASCHKCKKNKELVTVGPDQFPKLLGPEDETRDLEDLGLKIWDFLKEALVDSDDVALSIMDVVGVKYIPCSPFKHEKEVLIAWHVSVNGEGADSGVIVNSWESAICLHDKPQLIEKAERMFKTKL